ncbi:hypothetical protein Mapa_003213 [Marchantia paleacea]|nr:hypothetical protein Mapa_003213 [Marchantia paleacea]
MSVSVSKFLIVHRSNQASSRADADRTYSHLALDRLAISPIVKKCKHTPWLLLAVQPLF